VFNSRPQSTATVQRKRSACLKKILHEIDHGLSLGENAWVFRVHNLSDPASEIRGRRQYDNAKLVMESRGRYNVQTRDKDDKDRRTR
jgi:hypothetical protein